MQKIKIIYFLSWITLILLFSNGLCNKLKEEKNNNEIEMEN